jgi:predicted RNA-binding Zn-ribbon protein involved in translation (DUF1610 family)
MKIKKILSPAGELAGVRLDDTIVMLEWVSGCTFSRENVAVALFDYILKNAEEDLSDEASGAVAAITEKLARQEEVQVGWRYFECPDCGEQWREASRDCRSPSGDDCACCAEFVSPKSYTADDAIPVDASGNLIEYCRVRLKRGSLSD